VIPYFAMPSIALGLDKDFSSLRMSLYCIFAFVMDTHASCLAVLAHAVFAERGGGQI